MLDLLPTELWSNSKTTFLDPGCKTGVFLREIAKRLMDGLKDEIPDLQERANHIFTKQLFAIPVTELTAQLSRRSVYCSKTANGKYSICNEFKDGEGNIKYKRIEHTWVNNSCVYCGASKNVLDRGEELESYAYQFIHTNNPKEIYNMKFDVIIGNPPYQLNVGVEKENYAIPIYQKFVQQAKKLNPNYLVMITPSRWFTGGRGLDEFRKEMLNDNRIQQIVDFVDSKDCFPGVDLSGGASYFLWNKNYHGACNFTSIHNGQMVCSQRKLDEFSIFPRYNEALEIIHKIKNFHEAMLETRVSTQTPFGFITTFRGKEQPFDDSLTLYTSSGKNYVSRSEVKRNLELIDKYKIAFNKATCEHAGTPSKDGKYRIFSNLMLLKPKELCTQTYLLGNTFDTEIEANNFLSYLKTQFVRFLLLQALTSQDISRDKFCFVPLQDFSESWTDEKLYAKYGITEEEQAFINSMIRPIE
jgi:site-specific DNA-methyltransferase (adenine-specific)